MSPGPRLEVAPEEELKAIIANFEMLAAEIERAIATLGCNPQDQDIIALNRAKAAAMRGAKIAQRKLDSV